MPSFKRSLFAAIIVFFTSALPAAADYVTLAWDVNPEPEVTGYIARARMAGYPTFAKTADVGNRTSYTFTDLRPGTYEFSVIAYTSYGVQSDPSPELSAVVQGPPLKDFNGDGYSDLLWQHSTEGWLAVWAMNGPKMLSSEYLTPSGRTNFNWQVQGIADFNADGKPDLLWYNVADGSLEIWLMDGTVRTAIVTPNPGARVDKSWRIVAVADFNGDRKPDLVWRNMDQGWLECWYMDGVNMIDSVALNPDRITDPDWNIIGAMDVNGDGKQDLIWFHEREGWLIALVMNGTRMRDSIYMNPDRLTDFNWTFAALTDLNGDGSLDVVWQHKTTGTLVGIMMNGSRMMDSVYLEPSRVDDLNWKIIGPR